MSRNRLFLVLGTFFCGVLSLHAQFTWTGLAGDNKISTGGNWIGNVAPTGLSGTDDLSFAADDSFAPAFNSAFSVRDITLPSGAGFYNVTGSGPLTLTGNITTQVGATSGMLIGTPMILTSGTHTFNLAGSDVYLFNQIGESGGPANIVKTGVGSLIFDHGGETFTGFVDLQQGRLTVHNDGALGTGLIMMDGGKLVAVDYYNDSHLTTLTNTVSLSGSASFGEGGNQASITITGLSTAQSGVGNVAMHVNGAGVLTLAGVAETDPGTRLTFDGNGTTRVTAPSSYTGGTRVNNGVLIFAAGALPATGSLRSTGNGYLGTEDNTVGFLQTGFLNQFNQGATSGIVGLDSPDAANPLTFGDAIDLTGFNSSARLGSSSAVIISGVITPQSSDYLFGGRGTLTVNSALIDVAGSSEVQVYDGGRVFLHGANTYTGDTEAVSGAIIFTGANSIPAAPDLYADTKGYIGQTETAAGSLTANQYFALFYTPDTFGVVGFDADNPVAGRIVSDNMDFSIFDHDAFLGTASNVTFTGTINPFNNTYRFTGFRDGQLTVNTVLSGANSVVIGLDGNDITSVPLLGQTFRPSVTLNGANSYSGGTTLQSGKLILGNSTALGTGPLTIDINTVSGQPVGLVTNTAGLVIANDIIFNSSSSFYIGGSHDFTLAGHLLSSLGEGLEKTGSNTITLSNDNSGYNGFINVRTGGVIFANDNAAGTGDVFLDNSGATPAAAFFTTATPIMGSLSGDSSTTLNLGSGALTINQIDDGTFSGTISGSGDLVKFGPGSLTLGGSNTYGGNSSVLGGTLVVANSSALHGTVTVNNGATLSLNQGITVANPVFFGGSGGTLAGNGTFGSAITIGANTIVAPGNPVGLLTFSGGLTFAPSSAFNIQMQSVAGPRGTGFDAIDVTSGLTFTATLGSPLVLHLSSLDPTGNPGNVSDFSSSAGYAWIIAHSDTLSGFNAANITLDATGFTNSLGIGGFYLTSAGNDVLLNFSPVPEPSTYALLGLGLGVLMFPALRRRKRS